MTDFVRTTAFAAAAGLMVVSGAATAMPTFDPTGSGAGFAGIEPPTRHSADRYYSSGYDRGYGSRRVYYDEPVYRDTRVWRGRDGRYYCRKRDGTTGLIIGGAVGALIGRSMDRGYDRSTGTILGAVGGALLGREVARSGNRCR